VVPRSQPVALAGHGGNRYAGLAKRIDVAVDGANRAFALLGEIRRPKRGLFAQPRENEKPAVHLLHGKAKYTSGVYAVSIAGRVEDVRRRITSACERSGRAPEEVTLVAVTKGVAPKAIREAVDAGVRHLGENRVQEAEAKQRALGDIDRLVTWHMVGHLQTNKVKLAMGLFAIIHSVDSFHLAEAISKRSSARRPILLEVNVSEEPSKYGFTPDELPRQYAAIAQLPALDVRGLMTVAPQTANAENMRPHFRRLREAAERLGLQELSMGMSDDFEVAVEEGATHLRIGRAIFGERR
jgi:pyridoxal phosphate enzyme (YggS family)